MLHSLIELSEKSNKQNCPLHFGENWPPLTQSNSIVFCLFLPTWNLRRHPIMTYFFAKNKNSYLQQYEPKNYKRLPLKLIVSNKNRSLKLLHLWCEKQCQQELASLVWFSVCRASNDSIWSFGKSNQKEKKMQVIRLHWTKWVTSCTLVRRESIF